MLVKKTLNDIGQKITLTNVRLKKILADIFGKIVLIEVNWETLSTNVVKKTLANVYKKNNLS